MLCQVCNAEIVVNEEELENLIASCSSCGNDHNLHAVYVPPEMLTEEQAQFHFNCMYNAVANGITQIERRLKDAYFLDIGGTLKPYYKVLWGKVAVVEVLQPELLQKQETLPESKFDFIYLSSVLFQINNPRKYLSAIRKQLNTKGKLQIFIPTVLEVEECRNYFDMPALYQMLQMTGFTVISRMFITTAEGVLISCE